MAIPSLSDLSSARTSARGFGDGSIYALDFNVNGQDYTFVPENVVKNGGVSNDTNVYFLPWFANADNQKDFSKSASSFDLSENKGLADYLKSQGQSTSGYIIPSSKVSFDGSVSTMPTESLGGQLSGLKQVGDQIFTGVSGGHGSRYYDPNTSLVHDPYTEYHSMLGDVLGGAGEGISDFVGGIGSSINNTVQKALDDPIGTAITAAAIASGQPELMALANAGVAVSHGASLEDAALAAGKGYVAGQIGSEISSNLSPELVSNGMTAQQAATAAKIAGQVGGATLTGRDPLQALIAGGIGAGTSSVTSEIPGFEDMSKYQQMAVNRAVANTLQGRDPTPGLITEAIASGLDAANNFTPAPSNDLMSQTMPSDQNQTLKNLGGIDINTTPTGGYYDEGTGKFVPSEYGQIQGPLDNTSGANIDSMSGYTYDPNTQKWITPSGEEVDLSYLSNSQSPMDTHALDYLNKPYDTSLGDLSRSLMSSGPSLSDLAMYGGMAAGAAALLDDGSTQAPQAEPIQGQDVSWNQQTGSLNNGSAYGLAQLQPTYTQHAAQGGIMSLGGYASGGNPRLLRGPGDGMSDNIPATIAGKQPARLADGEFVIPADVVSHLGNGSTEAGANVLHQMMERVRKARTGNPNQGRQINPQKFIPSKGK